MKWKAKTKPKELEYRIVERFAYFPHRIKGTDTLLWLQKYWAVERYQSGEYYYRKVIDSMVQLSYYLEGARWVVVAESEHKAELTKIKQQTHYI